MSDTYSVVKAKISPKLKEEAVAVLDGLGISQTKAIESFFNYIATHKEYPFEIEKIVTLRSNK